MSSAVAKDQSRVSPGADPGSGHLRWGRAVAAGLAGAVLMAVAAPFNDYVLNNTFFIGNYLPLGAMAYVSVLIAANGVWSRLHRRVLLGGAEMAVVLAMVLCACAVPSAGLMRWLPAGLVGFPYQAMQDGAKADTWNQVELSPWLFPTPQATTEVPGGDPVYTEFVGRAPEVEPGLAGALSAVPWGAWLRPALAWGVFFAMLFAATLALVAILRRQWVENERLSFPLADFYSMLIAPPPAGRALNALFNTRSFQVTAGMVFLLHLLNGLSAYFPEYVPPIPLRFDLTSILTEGAWQHTDYLARASTLFFSMVGISYFLPTQIAFSLWFFFLLRQVLMMGAASAGMEVDQTWQDQVLGAAIMLVIVMLWKGRGQLLVTGRAMIGRRSEASDPFIHEGVAGWVLLFGLGGMMVWLWLAGVEIPIALLIVLSMLGAFLLMARVVAETGLLYATVGLDFSRPVALSAAAGMASPPSGYFMTQWMNHLTVPGLRENLAVYASHGLRVAQSQGDTRSSWRALPALMLLSVLLSFGVGGASMLICEYNYAVTLDNSQVTPLNPIALAIPGNMLEETAAYQAGITRPAGGPVASVATGGAVVLGLSWLRSALAWWPLHPVGYLLWQSLPLSFTWFSILLGWIAKTTAVRFGGARLYSSMRPVFIGLIIGEAGAAVFWMLTSFVLALLGIDYIPIRLLPGG